MKVLDQYAGQTGPCAVCAKQIQIPELPEDQAGGGDKGKRSPKPGEDGVALGNLLGILGGAVVAFSILFLSAVLIFRVAIPAFTQMQIDAQNRASLANIQKIIDALNAYHDAHGTFPPAYFADDKGKPEHSWRVMILPELGRQDLYREYRFDQPWDSAQNLSVTAQMPDVYRSYGDSQTQLNNTTRFAAVVGKRTVFPYDKSVSRSKILDDPASVLTIVEVQSIGFDWTDPTEDYDVDSPQGTMVILNKPTTSGTSRSNLTGNVGMLNGDTYHFGDATAIPFLRATSTRSGGEPVDIKFELQNPP